MSQINPLTGSVVQAPQVQRDQATEKSRQMRQAQELRRGGQTEEDQYEPHVASPEELDPASDHREESQPRPKSKPRHKDQSPDEQDASGGLDLTA